MSAMRLFNRSFFCLYVYKTPEPVKGFSLNLILENFLSRTVRAFVVLLVQTFLPSTLHDDIHALPSESGAADK
jgi:hypothetical protein